jgi:hypothetical protein
MSKLNKTGGCNRFASCVAGFETEESSARFERMFTQEVISRRGPMSTLSMGVFEARDELVKGGQCLHGEGLRELLEPWKSRMPRRRRRARPG